ncbi:hypothetical protein GCM10009847_05060 [Leucobacter tardus]
MTGRALLRIAAGVELGTLALLLLNMFTLDWPEVSRILGPVHGLAYIGTIVCAALTAEGRYRPWLLALIPGIGGVLAARTVHTSRVDQSLS